MRQWNDWRKFLDTISPEIIPEIKAFTIHAEQIGAPGLQPESDSFLWDHTIQVAAISFILSQEEEVDPLVPLLTALFHDAGKFSPNGYHQENIPEEQSSAAAARTILLKLGLPQPVITGVSDSLNTLYQENAAPELAADIVHDADFLSKFGFQGAAQLFIKSALRGRHLSNTVISSVSKELTYAEILPENMRTPFGQKAAVIKKKNSRIYFHGLLRELRDAGIMDCRIHIIKMPCPLQPQRLLSLHLVEPAACPQCGAAFKRNFSVEAGLKCRKLNGKIVCAGCEYSISLSFCLPEISC
jgi:hypothetical protein